MERGHNKKRLYVIFRYAFSMLSKEENNDNNHTFTKRFFFISDMTRTDRGEVGLEMRSLRMSYQL
jgi:hypothetical protein